MSNQAHLFRLEFRHQTLGCQEAVNTELKTHGGIALPSCYVGEDVSASVIERNEARWKSGLGDGCELA